MGTVKFITRWVQVQRPKKYVEGRLEIKVIPLGEGAQFELSGSKSEIDEYLSKFPYNYLVVEREVL